MTSAIVVVLIKLSLYFNRLSPQERTDHKMTMLFEKPRLMPLLLERQWREPIAGTDEHERVGWLVDVM